MKEGVAKIGKIIKKVIIENMSLLNKSNVLNTLE